MLRVAIQNVNRLRQIAQAIARYGFASFFSKDEAPAEVAGALAGDATQSADPAAVRFRKLLEELGPTFVKFGQILSTRPDILPPAFVTELQKLREAAPALAFAEVRAEIEATLRAPLATLFATFDETPVACASIAVVHRATLHDGRAVVVKVQRPGVDRVMRADLSLLYWFAAAAENVFAEAVLYRPTEIIDEFETALLQELDFRHEAENIDHFERVFGDSPLMRAPTVVEERSSSTVLTLEFLAGRRIAEIARCSDEARDLVAKILDISYEQIFAKGYFHADPHPGNLLVLSDGRVGLLDFGLMGRLTAEQRDVLIEMCLGIALRNSDALARLLYRVGRPDARIDLAQLRRDVQALLERFWGGSIDSIEPAELIRELMEVAQRHRVRLPKEYALLAKAAATIEGVIRELDPKLDIAATARPYATRLLRDEVSLERLQTRLGSEVLGAAGTLRALPAQIEQVMADLGAGKFTVTIENAALERLDSTVHRAGLLVSASILALALIVAGSVFAVALPAPSAPVGYVVAGLGVVAGAAAAGLSILDRLRGKIRLSRFVKRR